MNVQYEQRGDYLIPCARTKEQKKIHLVVWANRHRQYLKQSHKIRYYILLTSEKLYDYLEDIKDQAENMFLWMVDELAEKEGIMEAIKTEYAMEWVQRMNSIRDRAMEVVNTEVIYKIQQNIGFGASREFSLLVLFFD